MLPQAYRLSQTLRRHCDLVGWQLQHLPSQGAATETELLEELIACREAGWVDLSLKLIAITDQVGWQSPWLEDNRARALVKQQKFWSAAAIWRDLQTGADCEAAAAATSMLTLMHEQFEKQEIMDPALLELAEQGSPSPALKAVLKQALDHQRNHVLSQTHCLLRLVQEQGWIEKCPIDLKQSLWKEIQQLWQGVQRHPDSKIQKLAQEGLTLHQLQNKKAIDLENQLIQTCQQAGWPPRHLGQVDSTANPGMDRILQEIISCRSNGATLLSQRLIQRCRELGLSSPWLEDNEARLLQSSDRQGARNIWRKLLSNDDQEVRNTAAQALRDLDKNEGEAELLEAITATRERSQHRPWRPLLRQRLLVKSERVTSSNWSREAVQLPMQAQEAWDLHLRRHRLAQQLAHEQLELLEQQLSGET